LNLKINDRISVSDIGPQDKAAYMEHLRERQIYEQTLNIPFPYTEVDADWWLDYVAKETAERNGRSVNWAIRRAEDGFLIGGVGYHALKIGAVHKGEIGYWLAKPYWNQGIMSDVVAKMSDYGFKEFGLIRITANVFAFNIGSAKVLEKNGFQCEGVLRSHYKKDGRIFDGKLYAKLAD
jgi:RimJ/RimL family protein N-acetyltransferase